TTPVPGPPPDQQPSHGAAGVSIGPTGPPDVRRLSCRPWTVASSTETRISTPIEARETTHGRDSPVGSHAVSASSKRDVLRRGGVVMKSPLVPIMALRAVPAVHAATVKQPLHPTGVAPGAQGQASFALSGTARRGRRGRLKVLARGLAPGKAFG